MQEKWGETNSPSHFINPAALRHFNKAILCFCAVDFTPCFSSSCSSVELWTICFKGHVYYLEQDTRAGRWGTKRWITRAEQKLQIKKKKKNEKQNVKSISYRQLNRTQVNIEKWQETTQRQEMESNTAHMRAGFQNMTGNNKTTNSNCDTGHINLIFVQYRLCNSQLSSQSPLPEPSIIYWWTNVSTCTRLQVNTTGVRT